MSTTEHHAESLETRVARLLGDTVARSRTLTGGKIGEVVRIDLVDRGPVVAKTGGVDPRLTLEANMLRHLRERSPIPVPEVLHAEDDLLVLEYIDGEHLRPEAEAHCGALLAQLHDVTSDAFGFDRETLNGRIVLNSPWSDRWVPFFRDHRLGHALRLVDDFQPLDLTLRGALDGIVGNLDTLLREPERPSLLHGDLWSANVLSSGNRVTAFLDPSACYGDPEIELAYVAAWQAFGRDFWDAYTAHRPLDGGFHEVRRHLYALYPLLMHVYYFGDRFVPQLQATIATIRRHL